MSPFWKKIVSTLLPFLFSKTEQLVETKKVTLDEADAETLGNAAKEIVVETVKPKGK